MQISLCFAGVHSIPMDASLEETRAACTCPGSMFREWCKEQMANDIGNNTKKATLLVRASDGERQSVTWNTLQAG